MRTLIVEDEPKMAQLLARGLREEGHATDLAATGEEALWMARAVDYDAIVLDVMLPGGDGFSVCRELRDQGVWTPVLMLTARDLVDDRVTGLDAGADDYLVKPFAFSELLARLRALRRRKPVERPVVLTVGDLRLDPALGRAWRGAVELQLSGKEFALLEEFMRRPGKSSPGPACSTPPGTSVRARVEPRRRLHPVPAGEDRPSVRAPLWPSARTPICRLAGASRPRVIMRRVSRSRSSTRPVDEASLPRLASWTWATTPTRSTPASRSAAAARSSPSNGRRRSSVANTGRRRADTGPGYSAEPTLG